MSTPEALALSGRASDPSRDRGRAWYRSTGREVTVSSIPGPLTGSASVARLASWGERLRAEQPVKVKAFQAQFRKGFGNLIFRPVHSGLKLDTLDPPFSLHSPPSHNIQYSHITHALALAAPPSRFQIPSLARMYRRLVLKTLSKSGSRSMGSIPSKSGPESGRMDDLLPQ